MKYVNIIVLILGLFLAYTVVDIGFRFKKEHFAVETKPVRASNDRRFREGDDIFDSENEKMLDDVRQHILANDFKKYFYFSEIDIPNEIMNRALKDVYKRYGKRDNSFIFNKWRSVPKRDVNKTRLLAFLKKIIVHINSALPGKNLDTYYKPEVTVPEFTKKSSPDPTPNPSAIAETRPPSPKPTRRRIYNTKPTEPVPTGTWSNISKNKDLMIHLDKIRKGKGRVVDSRKLKDLSNYETREDVFADGKTYISYKIDGVWSNYTRKDLLFDTYKKVRAVNLEGFEGYVDYDKAKKYIQYYKLKGYKIVSVQRDNTSYRWVVNMSIYRPDKSTLFVIQVQAISTGKRFRLIDLQLISRESVDVDFLDKGYDTSVDSYKYLYEDPNLSCDMPAIFNERSGVRINPNCKKISYNNISRNRQPEYVTSDEVEIRNILDARYSSYQGFFRPVRFSFGEDALENRTGVDTLNTDTNQRFLDRI